MSEEEVKPRIVEAVFTSANIGSLGPQKSPLAGMIERAMSDAVTKAYADGVHDPDEMRKLMQEARQKAKDTYNAAVEKALAEQAGNPEG